jgi:hypothetical protein
MLAALAAACTPAVVVESRVAASHRGAAEQEMAGGAPGAPPQQIPLAAVGAAPLRLGLVDYDPPGGPFPDGMVSYALVGATPDTLYRVRWRVYRDAACAGSSDAPVDGGGIRTDREGDSVAARLVAPRLVGRDPVVGVIWELTPDGAPEPCPGSLGHPWLHRRHARGERIDGGAPANLPGASESLVQANESPLAHRRDVA